MDRAGKGVHRWTPLIDVPQADLEDLIGRLNQTRWPRRWPLGEPWTAGTDFDELRRLTEHWGSQYDWRRHEREINRLASYWTIIAGQRIHFLRFDAETPDAPAVVLTNGWPSTFFELVELARRLAEPSRYGDTGMAFTVVVPSLPGFTFSDPAASSPPTTPTHELWHRLMIRLGFETYFAHGGDLGSGITSRLAAAHPEAVRAIHVMSLGAPRSFDEDSLTPAEREHLAAGKAWLRTEGAYMHQHQTRPLTLAFGLSDSPVGLLSWILEKYYQWSDRRAGTPFSLADDFVLTQASLYWFTNTIGTSLRPYYEAPPPYEFVPVPTALALFPADLLKPPREWAERTHDIRRYTIFDSGGHFAPVETAPTLAADIRQFFAGELVGAAADQT
ncbi:epoxide hydrolase [Microbacterium kribbense]|uniref:Epoxide hydrolase n=1 Tax=Microbacterium kribbense TaxID=433645 RepID=A0ABP7GUU7_9MICO